MISSYYSFNNIMESYFCDVIFQNKKKCNRCVIPLCYRLKIMIELYFHCDIFQNKKKLKQKYDYIMILILEHNKMIFFLFMKKKCKGKGKGWWEEWGKREGKVVGKMCKEALLSIFITFQKAVVKITKIVVEISTFIGFFPHHTC